MNDRYILVGQTVVPCEDLMEWAHWFQENPESRRVKWTNVMGICDVSTIFLGLDYNYHRCVTGEGEPLLFESMTCWGRDWKGWEEQERCSTWAEAEAMHSQMVRAVARPRAVLAYIWRVWLKTSREAIDDAERRWRELRGLGRKSYGDPMLDLAMEQLEKLEARRRERDEG